MQARQVSILEGSTFVVSDPAGEIAARPDEPVSDAAIQYMNRLSDFLFVASRSQNGNGAGDVLWIPGKNR